MDRARLPASRLLEDAERAQDEDQRERADENLIRSINPLSEVEVQIDRGDGSHDTKYLEFDFHRVRSGAVVRQVLVTVNDVTSRVMLARELKESQASVQTQMDMLLGILHLDPQLVTSFLDDSSPALGLVSVETRAHDFEDMLNELRGRTQLSGSDFLPLVVRLDEMFGHLKSVRELVARVDGMRADQGKTIRLVSSGLDDIPGDYRKALRDIVIQMVRNAVVHGIEDAETRRGRNKNETGLLQVEFKRSEAGCELVFQDDGGGILADRIRETAVARGVIGAEEARALDSKAVLALIFRPGFSTHGGSDRDAGRGVGLDLVRRMVQSHGGRISVATSPGKYTRFRVLLPAEQARQDAVA